MNRRPTVLIVEDHPLNMKLVRSILTLAGYGILEAATGGQAIELATTGRPDLILMDIQLPDMDGLEATRILKGREETKDIPVVALTAHAMPGDEGKAKAFGCAGYIIKPIDTRNFIRTIEAYLGGQAGKGREKAWPPSGGSQPKGEPGPNDDRFNRSSEFPPIRQCLFMLEQELKRAARRRHPLSVLLLAWDGLDPCKGKGEPREKERFWRRWETTLRRSVREIDFVAPYGEDAFVLILPYTEKEEALTIAKRLKQVMEGMNPSPGMPYFPSCGASIGIAAYPSDGASAGELLHKAETALQQAREEGKGRGKAFEDPG